MLLLRRLEWLMLFWLRAILTSLTLGLAIGLCLI